MKKILFVIDSLSCGGAEKSLISLLNNIDYTQYDINLMVFKSGGEFEKFLPEEVKIIQIPKYFDYIQKKYSRISRKEKVKFLIYRIKTTLNLRINSFCKNIKHSEQVVYKSLKNTLEQVNEKYEVAIAYSQGFPTYFIAEKVDAKKKLAWINCNYEKTLYDKDIDNIFYKKIDKIVAVSDFIKQSLISMKYKYEDKVILIKDIVDPKLIKEMSLKKFDNELKSNEFNILTVGRLATVKGYDLAIKSAKILKNKGFKFKWYVIGEGPQRNEIEHFIIKEDLKDKFILLGSKPNPYPYIKKCDIYVQTSRKEGFGLSVVEAKILNKPIVITNFDTANELIKDKEDGYIVQIDEYSIADKLQFLIENKNERNELIDNLQNNISYSSVSEINKFYKIID